jgi:hypothetical protein
VKISELVRRCLHSAAPKVYFRALLIDVNKPLRLVPRPFTAAMIAIEIPAAIKPYSMAVAPVSSRQNLKTKLFICPALNILLRNGGCALPPIVQRLRLFPRRPHPNRALLIGLQD